MVSIVFLYLYFKTSKTYCVFCNGIYTGVTQHLSEHTVTNKRKLEMTEIDWTIEKEKLLRLIFNM